MGLIDDLKAARAGGKTDADLKTALYLQRRAQFSRHRIFDGNSPVDRKSIVRGASSRRGNWRGIAAASVWLLRFSCFLRSLASSTTWRSQRSSRLFSAFPRSRAPMTDNISIPTGVMRLPDTAHQPTVAVVDISTGGGAAAADAGGREAGVPFFPCPRGWDSGTAC
jgi:hypothetical protein